jgi:hypothetical protein
MGGRRRRAGAAVSGRRRRSAQCSTGRSSHRSSRSRERAGAPLQRGAPLTASRCVSELARTTMLGPRLPLPVQKGVETLTGSPPHSPCHSAFPSADSRGPVACARPVYQAARPVAAALDRSRPRCIAPVVLSQRAGVSSCSPAERRPARPGTCLRTERETSPRIYLTWLLASRQAMTTRPPATQDGNLADNCIAM